MSGSIEGAQLLQQAAQTNAGHGEQKGAEGPKGWRRLIHRKPKPEAPPEPAGFKVTKTDLLTTDSSIAARNRERKGTQAEEGDKIVIKENLRNEYVSILNEYTANLVRVAKEHPAILDAPGHEHEKHLLTLFTDGQGNANPEKINDFIRGEGSGQGMALATMIIEQQLSYKAFALGLDMVTRDPGQQDLPYEQVQTRLDHFLDGGKPFDKAHPWRLGSNPVRWGLRGVRHVGDTKLGASVIKAGGGLIGTAGGGLVGYFGAHAAQDVVTGLSDFISTTNLDTFANIGIPGAMLGGAVGAAKGYNAASLFTSEGRHGFGMSVDALEVIQRNPQESEYVKLMTGIDVRDYTVAGGEIIRSAGRSQETRGETHLIDSARHMLAARRDFYQTLGYPDGKGAHAIDMNLSRFEAGSAMKLTTTWEQRVLDRLNINQPPYSNATDRGRMRLMMEARQKVMMEMLEEHSTVINERGSVTKRKVDTIRSAQKELKDEGETKWTEMQQGRIKSAEEDKAHLEEIKNKIKGTKHEPNFTDEEKALDKKFPAKKLDAEVSEVSKSIKDIESKDFKTPRLDAIKEWRKQQEDILKMPEIAALVTAIQGGKGNTREVANALDRTIARYLAPAEAAYNLQIESINQQEQDAQAKLAELKIKQQQLTAVQEKRKISEDTPDREATVNRLQENFTRITTLKDAAGADIVTEADLRTLTIDDVFKKINDAYDAASTAGMPPPAGTWSKEFNDNPKYRAMLLNASVEADMRGATYATKKTPVEQRLLALDRRQARLQAQIDDATYMLEKHKPHDLIDQADIVLRIGEREADIFHKTLSLDTNVFSVARLTDTAPVQPGDLVTNQEQQFAAQYAGIGIPVTRGYLEFMDQLFDYKNRGDRGAYFEKVTSVLPPTEVIDVMQRAGINLGALRRPADVRRVYSVLFDYMYDKYSTMLSSR